MLTYFVPSDYNRRARKALANFHMGNAISRITLMISGVCWFVAQMCKRVRLNSCLKITWQIG